MALQEGLLVLPVSGWVVAPQPRTSSAWVPRLEVKNTPGQGFQGPARSLIGAVGASALAAVLLPQRRKAYGLARSSIGASRRLRRLAFGRADLPATVDTLDGLAAALELAERAEEYGDAVRLRDRIRGIEAESPGAALMWRQRKQVASLMEVALGVEEPEMKARIAAIKSLTELASPPGRSAEAEDALHRVLRETTGPTQAAAESGLWNSWCTSGEEEVDEELRRGIFLMSQDRIDESVGAFTRVTEMAPDFAEGWNKRATALFTLDRYDDSLSDCMKVLELKPRHFGCLSGLGMIQKSKGQEKEAVKWFKKAVEVHPGLNSARSMVLNEVLQEELGPQVGKVTDAFRRLADPAPCQVPGLKVTWDVHRVTPEETGASGVQVYFFRIRIRNEVTAPCPLRSLARYYVLQYSDGEVYSFVRPLEDQSSFVLRPGEEYRFCWALILKKELLGMAGGMLMERQGVILDRSASTNRYVTASIEPTLRPRDLSPIPMDKVQQLGQGYFYTGQLDLRRAKFEADSE